MPSAPMLPPGGDINGFQSFLAQGGWSMVNLRPDKHGQVAIKGSLEAYTGVLVVAIDGQNVVHEFAPLQEGELRTRRVELVRALDSSKGFMEVREVTQLSKHDSISVMDLSQLQLVDSLEKVCQFLSPLNREGQSKKQVDDFGLLSWGSLPRD